MTLLHLLCWVSFIDLCVSVFLIISNAANDNELLAILWLNPLVSTPPSTKKNHKNMATGLRIYDMSAATVLFHSRVSFYPSVHTSFLATSGSLNVDIKSLCDGSSSEVIPLQANRLILINSHNPVVLESMASTQVDTKSEADAFARTTSLTLVVQLVAK